MSHPPEEVDDDKRERFQSTGCLRINVETVKRRVISKQKE
jgi:hypothetical protein